jgi:hypothetical protein
VTVTRTPERQAFLGDIITTAVEGATNHWAQVSQYQYELDGEIHVFTGQRTGDHPRAVLHPRRADDEGFEDDGRVVTLATIATGIARIRQGVRVNAAILTAVIVGDDENDAGAIDADAADAIVRAGLFNEIVYG